MGRACAQDGKLAPGRVVQLEALPGWVWDARAKRQQPEAAEAPDGPSPPF